MLIVATFELSNPVLLVVLVETYDSLFHSNVTAQI
jgi:hypothetical protein